MRDRLRARRDYSCLNCSTKARYRTPSSLKPIEREPHTADGRRHSWEGWRRRGRVAFSPLALLFSLTLLISSSLLFLVQPMFAKMVLPELRRDGGGVEHLHGVLPGVPPRRDGYADFLTRRFRISHQVMIHAAVLSLAAILLPLGLPKHFAAADGREPDRVATGVLACSVGVPFLVISTTAPLVQRWFTLSGHRDGGDPYFLYAASNAGSMAALLAYPAIVEPLLRVGEQAATLDVGVWGVRDLDVELRTSDMARVFNPCF